MTFKEKFQKFVCDRIERTMVKKRNVFRTKKKDVTYTLWWWLARNIQDQKKLHHVCYKMASYLHKKNENLEFAGVTDIVVLDNTVFIYLKRPGIIIGKGGSRIDAIREEINNEYNWETEERVKTNDYRISLIEDLRSGYATVLGCIRHFNYEY